MTFTLLMVVVHVLATVAMVAGMIGRQLTRAQMLASAELGIFAALGVLASRFENLLVRPGSLLLAVTGILLAVLEGYPLFGFIQGGQVNWLLIANLLVLSIVALIIFVFTPRGKIYDAALKEARAQGVITPALRGTFHDPVVVWAHRWENLATLLIIILMVAKPF